MRVIKLEGKWKKKETFGMKIISNIILFCVSHRLTRTSPEYKTLLMCTSEETESLKEDQNCHFVHG